MKTSIVSRPKPHGAGLMNWTVGESKETCKCNTFVGTSAIVLDQLSEQSLSSIVEKTPWVCSAAGLVKNLNLINKLNLGKLWFLFTILFTNCLAISSKIITWSVVLFELHKNEALKCPLLMFWFGASDITLDSQWLTCLSRGRIISVLRGVTGWVLHGTG